MNIFLREEPTRKLIDEKFGSVASLTGEWEVRAELDDNFPTVKQISSVQRWITHGVPTIKNGKSKHQIIAFCGLLDVDPVAIFDFKRNGYFSKFAKIRKALQFGVGGAGHLGPLFEMYRPDENWPSDEISEQCFDRPWFAVEFDNDGNHETSNYALLRINLTQSSKGNPRAVHIAYRRKLMPNTVPDTMWRYYGSVIAIEDRLELYNEGGLHLVMAQPKIDEILFRTYFGGRPVEFRIASLHEFSFSSKFPFNDMSVIGFNW